MSSVPRAAASADRRTDLALGVTVAVLAAGLLASVVAARFSGIVAEPPAGITDAGPVVRAALPLVRVVNDLPAALTLGVLLLAATMVPGATRAASAAPN